MSAPGRYAVASACIWLVAAADALGALAGAWSVSGSGRPALLAVEGAVLLALLANSLAIKRWVYRNTTDKTWRKVAWLCLLSLVCCACGDVVNFNLPQSFYRHGNVVKHDYLADSVYFFAPGYLLLLVAASVVATANGLARGKLAALFGAATLVGVATFASLYLPGTGMYVSALTGAYAILITLVGASGIALVASCPRQRRNPAVWLVGGGLVMATVADAVIGQLWLYGNGGEGYYPAARYLNWPLYIGSQCLVIHLPRLALAGARRKANSRN